MMMLRAKLQALRKRSIAEVQTYIEANLENRAAAWLRQPVGTPKQQQVAHAAGARDAVSTN
jgi:hypothetical protein